MKFVQYQDCISPHQMPLAREIAKRVGEDNFKYLYMDQSQEDRVKLGWKMEGEEDWLLHIGSAPEDAERMLDECDVILIGYRDIDLIERMVKAGKRVFVQGERWFKPKFGLPGQVRMLHPGYRKMCRRFVSIANDERWKGRFTMLPIGVHAWEDMEWLGIKAESMALWAYYVEPTSFPLDVSRTIPKTGLKVLWFGRLLGWKRTKDLIKAARIVDDAKIDIFGSGPLLDKLKELAAKSGNVEFHPPVKIEAVRQLMREHDVLVVTSNASEGWGAVASEALEEGLPVVGTYEAGSTATLLPKENLYHAGDYITLANILRGGFINSGIGEWTASKAADKLLSLI